MIVITGHIRVPPENLERARPLMKAFIEATRQEVGCLAYSFGEDVLEPGRIVLAETWRDHEALMTHLNAPHFAAWRDANAGLGVFDRDLIVYQASDPKPL
jgi:quinol monooxygenase YgiN